MSDFRFISAQTEEFESDVEAAHASMTGMGIVPATAEMTYLEKVKWLDMYGVDLHPVIVSFYLGLFLLIFFEAKIGLLAVQVITVYKHIC